MTNREQRRAARASRRGGVLVITVLMTGVLLVLGAGLARLAASANSALDTRIDEKRALFLAEAALAESVAALRAGGCGCVATVATPARLGDGAIWTVATDEGGWRHRVRANAMVGSGRAALEAVVAMPSTDPLFNYTLNSDELLTINEGVSVDSYDSSIGSYNSQALSSLDGFTYANTNGDVASNHGIALNNDAHVFGDATPGPGYTVTTATGTYVHGSTAAALEPFGFPPVPVPEIASEGSLLVPALEHHTLPSGQYGYDALEIGNAGILTIQGPARLVVGDFSGLKDARLEIDATAGPVTIYVTGTYAHLRGFEAVPVSDSPMAVAFMISQAQDIVFPAFTKVRGAYYAPTSSILFSNSNEAWGSFAAGRIEMSNDMRFHFDEVLTEYWNTDGSSGVQESPIDAWMRAAMEPAAFEHDRRDPFVVLGVDPAELPSPANAWQF